MWMVTWYPINHFGGLTSGTSSSMLAQTNICPDKTSSRPTNKETSSPTVTPNIFPHSRSSDSYSQSLWIRTRYITCSTPKTNTVLLLLRKDPKNVTFLTNTYKNTMFFFDETKKASRSSLNRALFLGFQSVRKKVSWWLLTGWYKC